MSFVHLHTHTQYSLLDGAIRLDDLFEKVKEFNMPAVAMTDHGNMFGAIDFYKRAIKNGVKPILGCEIYFTSGSRHDRGMGKRAEVVDSQDEVESRHQIHHLVLLCKNNKGYRNLCKIITRAYLEGFYYKPRADEELLREYSEGLIALTACLKGEVGYNFFTNQDELAFKAIDRLKSIYKEDLYLEIQENGIPEQKIANEKILKYAKEHNMPLVATNDCHYLNKDDSTAQEVLLCIQTGKTLEDEKRMRLTTDEFYFKSPEIMKEKFHYAPSAIENTLKIADMCNVDLKWTDDDGNPIYLLPDYEITSGETTEQFFIRESKEGLEKRFNGPHFSKLRDDPNFESKIKKKYYDRLKIEVDMISKMGFPGYFLIVADFIRWSKQNDIPVGPGRGSGAGSIVAYALDITNIDPIKYNLLFERFINPERVSMPDFDIDFCQDRRGEVIDYVTKKYGEEQVAQIVTFGKLKAKAALKDVSRAYSLPYSEADMLSKLIPEELKMTLDKALDVEPKLKELVESDPRIKQIYHISRRLEGLMRHASVHAAGVIITSEPVVNYCPLMKGKEGERVVQFDKDFSEEIGLVKFDFLGLKTLTVIHNAVEFIRRDNDPLFDIEEIDIDDSNVYNFVSNGETVGVFQLESSGMIDLCKRLKPANLEEITAINALYRPGPIESGMVDDYIDTKHGIKTLQYPFQVLEPILKDTYGGIVYQEQVMNIARVLSGYSLGQADMLRRAMGKKKEKEMAHHREIFIKGAEKNGHDPKKADELYEKISKFAAYCFNKSHALAYALIAYQTAFLKHYYPGAFFAALLSTELNNTDKITSYINDATNYDIEVLPPDVNQSLWLFNVHEKNIRFGMGAVKNVGKGAVEEIIRERESNGPYVGFLDFCQRVDLKSVGKRGIESLILVGGFDQCEEFNRKTLHENMEMIVSYAHKRQEEKMLGKVSLFASINSEQDPDNNFKELEIQKVEDYQDIEKLQSEADLMGIYVSGHPLDNYKELMKEMSSMEIGSVQNIDGFEDREMILSGMITSRKDILSKKGDKMCFLNFSDLSGSIECVIFPKVFEEFNEALVDDIPLIINGRVKLSEDPRKFFPSKIRELKKETEDRVSALRIGIRMDGLTSSKLRSLKQLIMSYRGAVPVHIIFDSEKGRARLPLGEEFLVNPTPQLAAKINQLMDQNCVKFIADGKVYDV